MKKIIFQIILLISTYSLFAQNALIGSGFSTGWSNPSDFFSFAASAGTSRIASRNPSGTGNQYFRVARNWSGNNNEFSPSAGCVGGQDLDISASMSTNINAANTNCTNGAWYINCPNTSDNYVFKTPDGATGTSFVVFRIQGAVQTVSSVSRDLTNVYPGQTVTITANLSAAFNTGQAVYLRYTNNAFSSSTVTQMTGSGTTYTATIPNTTNTAGATVAYYIFTSGTSNVASNASNADYFSINLNNNGGSNYSYTVASSYTTTATGDYNDPTKWDAGIVPLNNQPAVVSHNMNLNLDISPSNLTISPSNTLSIAASSVRVITGNVTNNGTITANGVLAIASGNLTNSGTLNINDGLQINAGASIIGTGAVFGATSNLIYNTGGSYTAATEWYSNSSSGVGVPQNVIINAGSTLTFGTNIQFHQMLGNLSILGTFSLGTNVGGDLRINGNWTRAAAGVFNPNCREVQFNGTATQVVEVTTGGTEVFNYIKLNHTGTFKPSASSGNETNINIFESSCAGGAVLSLINTGALDINGRIFSIDNIDIAATPDVWIYVDGTRTITNSAGINNGEFSFKGQGLNQPSQLTVGVANNGGVGSLIFDNSVVVSLADGACNFGISGSTPITTLNGVLQIKLGGSTGSGQTPCIYGTNSILRFANTVDYQVGASDKTWAAGAINSGNAGIPYNVEINSAGTDLTINNARALQGNLTITNGSLTLNTAIFSIGGNWERTGASSAFTPNSNKVIFDGSTGQTINCTANSNTETFYDLDISPSAGNVTQIGSTKSVITNNLNLTTGRLILGSNEAYVTNSSPSAITGYCAVHSSSCATYIQGNLRRKVTTGIYHFPLGTATNYEVAKLTLNSNSNVDNILAQFNSGSCGGAPNFLVTPTNAGADPTLVNGVLNGGYFVIEPYDASNVLVGSPTINYDAQITFNGHTNGVSIAAIVPGCYTLIKQPSNCSGSWAVGGGTLDNSTQLATAGSSNAVTATLAGLSNFSSFAMGFNGAEILPISLINLTAVSQQNQNIIKWSTMSELNNLKFEIEKSIDGIHFNNIGQVYSNAVDGNSVNKIDYQFIDKQPIIGLNYYRLKQIDIDGLNSFSPVVNASNKVGVNNNLFSISPNPASSNIALQFNQELLNSYQVSIVDITGKVVYSRLLEGNLNSTENLNIQHLQSGIYFIIVLNTKTQLVNRVKFTKL
jgi:hypothetical protein